MPIIDKFTTAILSVAFAGRTQLQWLFNPQEQVKKTTTKTIITGLQPLHFIYFKPFSPANAEGEALTISHKGQLK